MQYRISAHTSGLLMASGATALFSLKGIFIKLAYGYGVDVTSFLALRLSMALPVYLLMGVWLYQSALTQCSQWQVWVQVAAVGVLGYYLSSYLDLTGLTYIGASLERLLLYLFPGFVLLINAVFFKVAVRPVQLVAMLLSYTGVLFFMYQPNIGFDDNTMRGAAFVLASCFTFAWYMVLSGRLITKVGSKPFVIMAMTAATFAMLLHYIVQHGVILPVVASQVWFLALLTAIFSTVLPSFLLAAGIARIGANQASVLGAIGPVFTAILAVLFLDELFSLRHALGMALVLIAVALLGRKPSSV